MPPITNHTRESLIAFERRVQELWESGELPSLTHLCGGNEGQLLDIFQKVRPYDWVFCSHRAHYHALLKGVSEDRLMGFIQSDRSMFIFDKELRFYQSAILGGTLGVAVGVAKALREQGSCAHVWAFLGDGAAENGALHSASIYATGHDLPVTFVIENNGRQVDTYVETRRGPKHRDCQLISPRILEYHYKPTWPHAGSGCAHQITFKRTTPIQ